MNYFRYEIIKFIVLSFLLLVRVIVLLNTCSPMLSCSVFSRVCLCVLLLCVEGRPPLWRGTVTLTLESWYTNLEQTPLNRCQQLPAPYKRLIYEVNEMDKQTSNGQNCFRQCC